MGNYACDGLQGYANLPSADGGVRAMLEVDGDVYVVAGTRLYAVETSTQVVSFIGSMNISTTAPVFMERNRRSPTDIMIVCDGLAYYYRVGTSFGQVTDADLLAPTSLTFVNGYFVIGTANNKFQSGALDDASAWDPLAFGRADASPDAVLRVANYQGDLAVFGTQTIQFHRDAGTTRSRSPSSSRPTSVFCRRTRFRSLSSRWPSLPRTVLCACCAAMGRIRFRRTPSTGPLKTPLIRRPSWPRLG